tara:strand:+ start:31 stop:507 length:477 start_codon:yes stop_codon:yes gene_type:complete
MANERYNQLGKGMAGTAGQLRSQGYNTAQAQAQNAFDSQQQRLQGAGQMGMTGAQMYGDLGTGLGQLGQMGQGMLSSQVNTLNTLGGQARGIADNRLASQYKTAEGLSGEPLQRLMSLANLIGGMLPKTGGTGITTDYGSLAAGDQSSLIKSLLELFK